MLNVITKTCLQKWFVRLERKECMLGQCDECPGKQPLIDYIYELVGDFEDDLEIKYKDTFISKWSVIGHWKNRKNRYIFITALDIVARMLKISQYMGTYVTSEVGTFYRKNNY